jgi:hypothetical protein
MPDEQLCVVVMARREVRKQLSREIDHLVLRERHDALHDLGCSRSRLVQLLARQEQPGDDARRVRVQASVLPYRELSGHSWAEN